MVLRYTSFKNLKTYKPTFRFLESISADQKSNSFICSYLRSSWFQISAIWLAESLLKTYKPTFIFTLSQHAKIADWHCCSWYKTDLRIQSLIDQEHFWPQPTKHFEITFQVHSIYLNMQKIILSQVLLRYS